VDSRWARVARGSAAAGFATFVAAFSHAVAGGSAPTPFAVFVTLVLSGLICILFTGGRPSTWRLTVSVAASQALFHGLFSSLETPLVAEHDHSVVIGGIHSHATMWGAHAVAAAVTIVVFRFAETASRGIAQTAQLLFARLVAYVVPIMLPPRVMPAAQPFVAPHFAVLLPLIPRRGPPALSFA